MSGVPAGERRVVSVLVADVAGSTTIAERLGPERSKFLLDEVVRLMGDEVARYGGTLAQLTGDGVLALFGAPAAHEDDSERAVRVALGIQDAVRRFAAEVQEAYGVELAARVAVNTGPVVIPSGDLAHEERYNALGDTVNVAARLQAAAGAGGVAVGPATARQVEGTFELEPLGELELKGRDAAVASFRVAGLRERGEGVGVIRLVGRERELDLLDEALADLADGRGSILVITGEPGIGKSRLKTEGRKRYRERIHFLEGHAVSYAEAIPYWPVRELLRDWLRLGVSDQETRVRVELKAGLAQAGVDKAYPFLATLLGVTLEPDAAQRLHELSRDSVRQQTVEAVSDLVCALADERPLCLVLDDLHWADEATLDLLEQLLPLTEREPVAVALLYRSEREHGSWELGHRARQRYPHRFLELELGPLEAEATLELAGTAAGAELPESVAARLAERAGGNPFFLEEALRDLLERGALRRSDGHLELAIGVDELAVPAAIQEALQARLDRLDPPTREVLGVAAVAGRSFGLPLLERVAPGEGLLPALSELQRLELVVEERRRPAREYRFRHGLVQEAAYGSLVEARRRELHRSVGEALEALHDEAPEEVYGILARHFSEADDAQRAVDYLLKAGDAARALYADEEALDHYGRALGFLRETGDEAQARETLFKIGLTHHLAFDFERANEAYEQAFALRPPEPRRLEPSERIEASLGFVDSLVPGHANTDPSWELVRHLYRGLVRVGPELELQPDLAEAFEIGPDGLVYRFRLRPDVRWSDGVPVTAEDFVFTWRRMREEAVETAFMLEDIDSTEATDARTLEVRLREPRSYFLYSFAAPPFFAWPRHVCERLGADWHEAVPHVGSGPCVLAELDENHALLDASPTWYGPRGNAREVDLEFATAIDLTEAWQGGRYDALLLGWFPVGDAPDTIAESSFWLGTNYIGFQAVRPPFDDPRVRRAFAHALDRERLSETSGWIGDGAGGGGLVPPAMPGHSHRVAPEYDLDRARRLLAEAGYPGGQGLTEIKVVAPKRWQLTIFARELAKQLASIGVRAQFTYVPTVAIPDALEQDADACVWGFNADYPDPSGMLYSVMTLAPTFYRDSEIEGLLERARSLRDQDERLRMYREVERLWIGEQAAIVPFQYSRRLTLRRPWIEGLWLHGLGSSTLAEVVVRPELRP